MAEAVACAFDLPAAEVFVGRTTRIMQHDLLGLSFYFINYLIYFLFIILFSCQKRLLFVYLHNDNSICVNIFVKALLQYAAFGDYVEDHAILWPCDVTLPATRCTATTQLAKMMGHKITARILSAREDCFPMLLLFAKQQHDSVVLLKVVDGSKAANEVMDILQNVESLYSKRDGQRATVQRTLVRLVR